MISCSDEHEVIETGQLANAAILKRFEQLVLGLTFSNPRYTPMIKSKPAALPSYSTHSLIAAVVCTVEVILPATPPAVSSGERAPYATLRLPLSIINGDVPQTPAANKC